MLGDGRGMRGGGLGLIGAWLFVCLVLANDVDMLVRNNDRHRQPSSHNIHEHHRFVWFVVRERSKDTVMSAISF